MPTSTGLEAFSEVELGAGPMSRLSTGLTDLVRIESGVGVNAAVSDTVEAANVVEQSTVALSDGAETGTSPHDPIATPPSSKETVPDGSGAPMTEVTVAANVTVWLVTGESGEADSAVDVSLGPGSDATAGAAIG